jgi:predicted F0F1-ATPase subunit
MKENLTGSEPKPPSPEAQNERGGEKRSSSFWRLVATMSSLGWSLVLPIVGGVLLGEYLDKMTGQRFVWTVGLLFGGVAISLYNLYRILFKETIE